MALWWEPWPIKFFLFKKTHTSTFPCDLRITYFICTQLRLCFFSEQGSYENSEALENGTYDESGDLDDSGYSEVEYDYEDVGNQDYGE